jgi:hypothetical protein
MFWGLSSIEWTALAAIGTLTLALATLVLGGVTVWAVRSERRRDDQLRRTEGEAQADRNAGGRQSLRRGDAGLTMCR